VLKCVGNLEVRGRGPGLVRAKPIMVEGEFLDTGTSYPEVLSCNMPATSEFGSCGPSKECERDGRGWSPPGTTDQSALLLAPSPRSGLEGRALNPASRDATRVASRNGYGKPRNLIFRGAPNETGQS